MPFPSPGNLPDSGIELASPVSPALQQADSLLAEPLRKPYPNAWIHLIVGQKENIQFNFSFYGQRTQVKGLTEKIIGLFSSRAKTRTPVSSFLDPSALHTGKETIYN